MSAKSGSRSYSAKVIPMSKVFKISLARLFVALGFALDWFHLKLITDYFTPFIEKRKSIVVVTPPGIGKTACVILTIVAIFLRDPLAHVIVLSNAESLANMIARNVLRILRSDVARSIRPIEFSKCTESEFTIEGNDGRPSLIAAGSKSMITGSRCDYLVIDDAVKDQDQALSETMNLIWESYTNVAETRIMAGGVVCIVGTRWALSDLIGRVIQRATTEKFARQFSVINLALRNPDGKDSYEFTTNDLS